MTVADETKHDHATHERCHARCPMWAAMLAERDDQMRPEPVADETNAGGLTDAEKVRLTDGVEHTTDALCWNPRCDGSLTWTVERIVAEREAAVREQGRAEADAGWAEVIGRLADEWANQPTDYDEDTEQQIEDGRTLRLILTADHAKALAAVKVKAAQEALREAAGELLRGDGPGRSTGRWLALRADRLTTDTP